MENKCPNCGKVLPEEAAFCLYCFTDIQSFKKSETHPVTVVADEKSTKKIPVLVGLKSKFNKKLFCRIGVVAAFLLIIGICIFAMRNINSGDSLKTTEGTTIINETSTVAVTDSSGEAVTDESGEQVFDIVEVTKIATVTTTEKQGFFDKVFGAVTNKNDKTTGNKNNKTTTEGSSSDSGDKITETTEKQGFFDDLIDNIFGDKEETTAQSTTTSPTTESNTTEEHGTTENHTTQPAESSTTTTKETTEKPTQATTQTTEVTTTENGSYYFEYKATSASYPNGNITLTKYIGNASVVTVPSFIDGRKVSDIGEKCFCDDSKITKIIFDEQTDYIISFERYSLYNLTSLTEIISPRRSFYLRPHFSYNCPILYIGKGNGSSNKLTNGMYFSNGLMWVTTHPSVTTMTIPETCKKIDNGHNLDEVNNIKVINIHKDVSNIPKYGYYYSEGLQAINVESGNTYCISKDGVLFSKLLESDTEYKYCVYPYSKTDKVFKMPENEACTLQYRNGSRQLANAYLEELWLYEKSSLVSPTNKDLYNICYPNLKRIYIKENNPQYEDIRKTFTGEIIVF